MSSEPLWPSGKALLGWKADDFDSSIPRFDQKLLFMDTVLRLDPSLPVVIVVVGGGVTSAAAAAAAVASAWFICEDKCKLWLRICQ